jgi:hypothetical protein
MGLASKEILESGYNKQAQKNGFSDKMPLAVHLSRKISVVKK